MIVMIIMVMMMYKDTTCRDVMMMMMMTMDKDATCRAANSSKCELVRNCMGGDIHLKCCQL